MYVAVLIGLAGFLIFSILAAITFGNADLSLKDVYSVIAYKLFHIKSLSAYAEGAVHDVVWLESFWLWQLEWLFPCAAW